MKQNTAPATATVAATSQDAQLLARETLRISAKLASESSTAGLLSGQKGTGMVEEEFVESSMRLICLEQLDGRRWKYIADKDPDSGRLRSNSLRAVSLHAPLPPIEEVMSFVRSYVVPEGFPESVTEKFDGTDYGFYKMQIKDYLYGRDLHLLLEEKKSIDMKEEEWKLLDRKVMSIVRKGKVHEGDIEDII